MLQAVLWFLSPTVSPWRDHASFRGIEGEPYSTIFSRHERASHSAPWWQGVFANVLRLERLFAQFLLMAQKDIGRGVPLISFPSAVLRFLSLVSKQALILCSLEIFVVPAMDFPPGDNQPFSGEPSEELFFGIPKVQNAVYSQGGRENTFEHQQNLGTGSHMPTYNSGQIVGAPQLQWVSPPHAWNPSNINPSENYDLSAVSYRLLLIVDYISYFIAEL